MFGIIVFLIKFSGTKSSELRGKDLHEAMKVLQRRFVVALTYEMEDSVLLSLGEMHRGKSVLIFSQKSSICSCGDG